MTITVQNFYATFGVQYTLDPERGEAHPLGMHKDGYALIQAPDLATARGIANAIFGDKYAFLYPEADFLDDGTFDRWYNHEGSLLLLIKWVQ